MLRTVLVILEHIQLSDGEYCFQKSGISAWIACGTPSLEGEKLA